MAASINIARKRKTKAKSKKKGWKKVDITELEDFLEDERIQQRTGGLVSDKSNETLFFLDDDAKASSVKPGEVDVPKRKHERKNRPLRCFANLEPNPNIKAARSSHNRKKVICKPKLRVADQCIPLVSARALRQRKECKVVKRLQRANRWKTKVNFNLWDDADIPTESNVADEHYKNVTRKRRIKVPHHYYQKTSELSPIENPHAGQSYNPTYVDHQDLLLSAHTIEEKKIMTAIRLAKSLKPDCELHVPREEMEFEQSFSDSCVSDSDCDMTKISINPPVRREDAKTVKQREKDRRKKIRESSQGQRKKTKSMIKDLNSLGRLMKDIKKTEDEQTRKARAKIQRQVALKDVPKKLGKLKYTEPDIDIQLSEDLKGSLRLLKPEGHLLQDRFHSLQKRNVIETRLKVKKEKKKRSKMYEKKTHREIDKLF